jgi:PKD domain
VSTLLGTFCLACGDPAPSNGVVTVTGPTQAALTIDSVNPAPSGMGLAAVTVFTFSLAPSGGEMPYVISWDFGDGTSGTGATVSHLYTSQGNFIGTATLTDSKSVKQAATFTVATGSVTGQWNADFDNGRRDVIDLVQVGAGVTAAIYERSERGMGKGTGAVSNPRSLALSAEYKPDPGDSYVVTYIGTLDPTLSIWTGTATATGHPTCPCPFRATRQ